MFKFVAGMMLIGCIRTNELSRVKRGDCPTGLDNIQQKYLQCIAQLVYVHNFSSIINKCTIFFIQGTADHDAIYWTRIESRPIIHG